MSKQNVSLFRWIVTRAAVTILVIVVCVSTCTEIDAGSVFMKNGYIIQGPVVERSREAFVVGWENGKMTIHRRFVDSIVYEPGEEERLDEWERVQAEDERATRAILAGGGVVRDTKILPNSLDEFIEMQGTGNAFDGMGTGVSVVDGGIPGDGTGGGGDVFVDNGSSPFDGGADPTDVEPFDTVTVDPVVDVVPRNSLGERVHSGDQSFSLRVPEGWNVRHSEGALEVAAEAVDGIRPSLNVVELERGDLDWQACVDLAAEARSTALASFELAGEGTCRIGQNREAFEVVGSATANDRKYVVRQVLVADAERVWLFSTFTAGGEDDPNFSLLEECLESVEFASVTGD
jgi:hypothetical protein